MLGNSPVRILTLCETRLQRLAGNWSPTGTFGKARAEGERHQFPRGDWSVQRLLPFPQVQESAGVYQGLRENGTPNIPNYKFLQIRKEKSPANNFGNKVSGGLSEQ